MAYSKQNFRDGQTLNAANLEAMENGIIAGQGVKNLLINSNFKDPINSSGQTSWSTSGQTIDKWRTSSAVAVSLTSSSITVDATSVAGNFQQDINDLPNGTYTFAALVNGAIRTIVFTNSNGTITTVDNSNASFGGSGSISAGKEGNTYYVQINNVQGHTNTIAWAALYEGNYTANTLPNYVPKDKHVEMLDCGVPISPKNVLKNSDFTHPLNTNGFSNISSGTSTTIDCWNSWIAGNDGKIELTSSGIKLSPPSSETIGIYQQIENYQLNKIYTVVVYINDLPYLKSFQMGNFGVGTDFGSVQFFSIPSAHVLIRINSTNSEVTIQKVALYEGVYTLDTIPMYQSESKHVEMLNCGVPLAPYNLLDNSYFIKNAFVAQAGLNEKHGSVKYLGDRWVGHASISASQQNDGIVLTSSSQYADIRQKVNTVVGKTYTYAINATGISNNHRISIYNDGMNSLIAFNIGDSSNEILLASFVATTETTCLLYHPGYASSGGTAKIIWAALYEGSYTVDTLPPYVPKGKRVEMLNCGVSLQPYNLLDNSDFRIAQAGYGGMHGTRKYACDRWYDTYGFGSFSFNKLQGLTVAYGTNHAYLVQNIEDASRYHGKTMTMAFGLSDGTILTANGVWMDDALSFKINFDNGHAILRPYCVELVVTSGSLTINWAALYEGAYTADALPAYQPKGYAAELAECQRYYYPVRVNAMRERDSDNLYACSRRINMRNTPTVTLTEFAPYGENSITDFTNCSVNADQDYIYYARLPTCLAHNFGGLAMTLSADL